MVKKWIFCSRKVNPNSLARLKKSLPSDCELVVWEDRKAPTAAQLVDHCQTAFGLISLIEDCIDETFLNACPLLRVVAQVAIGTNNIDIAACNRKNIVVTNTPDCLSQTVAEMGIGLLLAVMRRVVEAHTYIQKGSWDLAFDPGLFLGQDLFRSTVGLVGYGGVGKAIAKALRYGFGVRRVVLFDSRGKNHLGEKIQKLETESVQSVQSVQSDSTETENLNVLWADSLSEFCGVCDAIVLCCPLTDSTRHLFDARAFKAMKSTAVLINIARGPVVHQGDLVEALRAGEIAGAGLDVFENEPIEPNHELLRFQNVVVTPHIGSASVATRKHMADIAVDSVLDVLNGKMPDAAVNRESVTL